jgi:hypothetical protein
VKTTAAAADRKAIANKRNAFIAKKLGVKTSEVSEAKAEAVKKFPAKKTASKKTSTSKKK